MSSGNLQEVKNNGRLLNHQPRNAATVAYRRWSFTRGSNCKALTMRTLVFSIGGCFLKVVPHGSSTVLLPGYFVAWKKKQKTKNKKQLPCCNITVYFHAKWRLRTECRKSITCHYPDQGSAPEWSSHLGNLLQPIRNTNQIWIVMHHQYYISALVPQTSFCVETSGGITSMTAVFLGQVLSGFQKL